MKLKTRHHIACFLAAAVSLQASGQSNEVNKVISSQKAQVAQNKSSQEKINSLSDQTSDLLYQYKLTLEEIENLKIYNNQLREVIKSQEEEVLSIKDQIRSVEMTSQRIIPLLVKMVSTLEEFISLDSPFLKEERVKRLNSLKDMMTRADVTTSEKYRRIMEAYQIENEYGRTIESYRDSIQIDGKEVSVEFLRVGRIALIYKALDGSSGAYWDQKTKSWQELDSIYIRDLKEGIKMAKKYSAPSLITLPFPTAEVK